MDIDIDYGTRVTIVLAVIVVSLLGLMWLCHKSKCDPKNPEKYFKHIGNGQVLITKPCCTSTKELFAMINQKYGNGYSVTTTTSDRYGDIVYMIIELKK